MAGGWVIGVLVTEPGEPRPVRHYFAIGLPDQAQAEWRAVDAALRIGRVATSPQGGLEPVAAIRALPPVRMTGLGLRAGEVRPLGWRHPRRWLA